MKFQSNGKDIGGFSLVFAVLATRQQAAHLGGILRVRNRGGQKATIVSASVMTFTDEEGHPRQFSLDPSISFSKGDDMAKF